MKHLLSLIAICVILSSCGSRSPLMSYTPEGVLKDTVKVLPMSERDPMRPPFVVQMHDKPIDYPFSCIRSGEIVGDDQDYFEAEPLKKLSFHTYEIYGDLTRSYGNVTYGYARVTPNKSGRDLSTDVFNTREVDPPYSIATVHINEEYIIIEVWATAKDPIDRFYVYSNDCQEMEGIITERKAWRIQAKEDRKADKKAREERKSKNKEE